jgi:hypothetical protein
MENIVSSTGLVQNGTNFPSVKRRVFIVVLSFVRYGVAVRTDSGFEMVNGFSGSIVAVLELLYLIIGSNLNHGLLTSHFATPLFSSNLSRPCPD